MSKKDIEKEHQLDALVPNRSPLPVHLKEFTRRGSRVDANVCAIAHILWHRGRRPFKQVIYADSPIDTSLFSLYIHQNYPQFCNETEEAWYIADTLSLIDATNDNVRASVLLTLTYFGRSIVGASKPNSCPAIPYAHLANPSCLAIASPTTQSEDVQTRVL
jgi:hypothetical protein